jgi:hypothetical protein
VVSVEAEEEVEGDAVPSDLSRLSQIKFAQEFTPGGNDILFDRASSGFGGSIGVRHDEMIKCGSRYDCTTQGSKRRRK